ncbi:MAG: MBL fold metallo-hydrolase [Promethearchaeota archaeon]
MKNKLNTTEESLGSKITKIVLLGTGNPAPDPERSGPSVAIIVNKTPYIIDCGAGIVRRAAAAYREGIKALKSSKLKIAFITHLHSDHTIGYADLILTPWVMRRSSPLEVYGPKGLQAMTDNIHAAYNLDIHERLNGLEQANDIGYKVNVHEITPGVVYKDRNVTIEAFSVKHGTLQSFGFKFITPDKTIAISGDTAPFKGLVENYKNCDVLIHEVYSSEKFKKLSPVWQKYHSSVHTSSYELAEIASKAKPSILILYHQIFWGGKEEALLAEIKESYNGKVVSGKDLQIF